jgi:biotin carboxylase
LAAVQACRSKYEARKLWRTAGLLIPKYFRVPLTSGSAEAARRTPYPCVLKPLGLSASRGVIRANNEIEFIEAFDRIRWILSTPDIRRHYDETDQFIQVEAYIPGSEFAIEGLITAGRLRMLAIFDKPDPLDGPYFEETIYVTPSRQPQSVQKALAGATERAIEALGLRHGPVHAEMRYNDRGVWMLEVAARPIGGLCSRSMRFTGGASLEELLIRHALGEDVSRAEREPRASGVMMIPIPENGNYAGVEGLSEAERVAGVDQVVITAKEGQRLLRLPEGASYLGFIFAAGDTADAVEQSLRQAHACLRFDIAKELKVM